MDPNIPGLLSEVEHLGKSLVGHDGNSADAQLRSNLLKASQKLCIALRSPGQLVEEVLFGSADQLLIKIGVDLGIFKMLAESRDPVTLKELAKSTKGEEALLERIMRGLASIHAVDETDVGQYDPSKLTTAFASTKGDSGARLFYDLVIPGMQPLPKFLAATGYRSARDPSNLPFNLAFGPDLFFQWLPKHPEVLANVQQWMMAQRDGHTSWLDFYPFEEQIVRNFDRNDPRGVLLVDVGGSMGQEILDIQGRYPDLPGRMVLQDLPSTIDQVPPSTQMEAMPHDFFTPQPIKGARVYYLRNILHDWDDGKCLIILRNIAAAMKPGYSRVLVNEFAIPNRDACAFSMRSDFMVMALAGAVERTETQWSELLAASGLKVNRIWTAELESQSIIDASLA